MTIGKIVEIKEVNEKYDIIMIEEHETKEIIPIFQEYEKDKKYEIGQLITAYCTVNKLANANLDFEYPEGTICTLREKVRRR